MKCFFNALKWISFFLTLFWWKIVGCSNFDISEVVSFSIADSCYHSNYYITDVKYNEGLKPNNVTLLIELSWMCVGWRCQEKAAQSTFDLNTGCKKGKLPLPHAQNGILHFPLYLFNTWLRVVSILTLFPIGFNLHTSEHNAKKGRKKVHTRWCGSTFRSLTFQRITCHMSSICDMSPDSLWWWICEKCFRANQSSWK